jgi:hypothetical protein
MILFLKFANININLVDLIIFYYEIYGILTCNSS